MKTRLLSISMLIILMFMTAACGQSPRQDNSATTSTSEAASDTKDVSAPTPADQEASPFVYDENHWPDGPNINGAPVEDLTDLTAVTAVYVWPLTPNGAIWFESWASPAELSADILVYVYAFNHSNEIDWDAPFVPAKDVEAWLQKHFAASAEYLHTAGTYQAEQDTYQMPEGGGGWAAVAMAAEQQDDQIIIKVGKLGPEETVPSPMGTLIVQLNNQSVVNYVSFELE